MVRRYSKRSDKIKQRQEQGSVLWTILLLGVGFCTVDFLFLFAASHYQDIPHLRQWNAQEGAEERSPSSISDFDEEVFKESVITQGNQNKQKNDFRDKEKVFQIILAAGMGESLRKEGVKEKLPTWQQVVDRLGPAPRIYGLESCDAFQSSFDGKLEDAFVAVAGAFNSGTNLLAELLIANCVNPSRLQAGLGAGVRWQVNWGKHTPPKKWRNSKHETYKDAPPNENALPAVTVRDPYSWFQSMCRNRYATHWFHEVNFHCPNFIPNHVEYEFLPKALDGSYKRDRADLHHDNPWLVDNVMNTANFTMRSKIVPVYVKYASETVNHDSLAHMWSEWNRQYYDAEYPRLMVRYEDLIFYGKEVTTAACECFGGKMKQRGFRHKGESAKVGDIHMNKTSLVDNMIRFIDPNIDLKKGMTEDDLEFAKKVLDKEMMEFFR
eukprot:CAMPEP_0194214464 /NCGR_PEP_ID=MMETSP0156-20130528/15666_1 /TAXON_ID=33649 /ORGANISM="Thalassionema nitzschioides, Strain L26-B" /LENGTH=436 /DNA_ID=CAMNT_0038942723 /DNA_START=12 /DNA_END=1318 /DNA_ORIENTATION=+